jgi:hypothetical protein
LEFEGSHANYIPENRASSADPTILLPFLSLKWQWPGLRAGIDLRDGVECPYMGALCLPTIGRTTHFSRL